MEAKSQHGNERNADFRQFEPLRDAGLVVAIGELTAERGEEEKRRDEDRGGKGDQGIRAAQLEQNKKDQRILEEIVAECREELAPEQGREAPRHQKGRRHGLSQWTGLRGRG